MKIGQNASSTIELTNNPKFTDFWRKILIYQIEKKSRNLLIFQFGKFQKFAIWKGRKIRKVPIF